MGNQVSEKVVSQQVHYKAVVHVVREGVVVINPNGRGYAEDNVERSVGTEVLSVTVRAATPEKLRLKVEQMLLTMDDEGDEL